MNKQLGGAIFLTCLLQQPACALDVADGRLELNAYGTYGFMRSLAAGVNYRPTDSYQYSVGNDWSGRFDNRLGIQATFHATNQVSLIAQLLVRRNGADEVRGELPWAYLRWQPDANWELRLGRFRQPLFLITESFDVGYAHLWVRPPAELYTLAGEMTSLNGMQLRYRESVAGYTLTGTLHAGHSEVKRPTYTSRNQPNVGGSLALTDQNLTLQATLINANTQVDIPAISQVVNLIAAQNPDVANEYALGHVPNMWYGALSARYEKNGWQLISELASTRLQRRSMRDRTAWYVTLGKNLGDWTPYISYASNKVRDGFFQEDRVSGNAAMAANALLLRRYTNQHTWSLGVRWDVASGIALKAQWDQVHPEINGLQMARLPDGEKHFNVVSVIADWAF